MLSITSKPALNVIFLFSYPSFSLPIREIFSPLVLRWLNPSRASKLLFLMPKLNPLFLVLKLPFSEYISELLGCSAFLVMMLITPAIASLPNIELWGPRIISILSISAEESTPQLTPSFCEGLFASIPSIKTSM